MTATSIEWATAVWNPIVGCERIAAGCANCYAERWVRRGMQPGHVGLARSTPSGPRWTGEVRTFPERLAVPLRRKKPERYFANSLSDVGHHKVPEDFFRAMVGVALLAPRHRFIFLTKRAARVRRMMEAADPASCLGCYSRLLPAGLRPPRGGSVEDAARALDSAPWPPPNLVIGASIAEQADALLQLDDLVATPAACRIVSYEPALARVDFDPWLWQRCSYCNGEKLLGREGRACHCVRMGNRGGMMRRNLLHGILVGGEAGPGARRFDLEFARSTIRQGRAAGAAVFVKQLGARPVGTGADLKLKRIGGQGPDREPLELRSRKGNDPAEWPEDLRVRELPKALELEPAQ